MAELYLHLASYLTGPAWRFYAESWQEAQESRCTACGRVGSCASDCAPIVRIPARK